MGLEEGSHEHPLPDWVLASSYLHMVGPQHDPAAEAIAQVDDSHAAAEAHDAGQGYPQCGNEDLRGGRWGPDEGAVTTRVSNADGGKQAGPG